MARYDAEVMIVGAGPLGIQMAGVLKRAGVDYLHLEAGQIGQTLMAWPRNTVFFSSPEWIAIGGIPIHTQGQGMVTAEEYLTYLRTVVESLDLKVHTYQKVTEIRPLEPGFEVRSDSSQGQSVHRVRAVVLAVGDMSFPRKLGIPGEDLPTVSNFMQDPHAYFQSRLLIVGGRNSALEMAVRCWRAGARVTISYRQQDFDSHTVISRLHLDVRLLIRNGQIDFLPLTEPVEFGPGYAKLRRLTGQESVAAADTEHSGGSAAQPKTRAGAPDPNTSGPGESATTVGRGPTDGRARTPDHAAPALTAPTASTNQESYLEVPTDFVYLATGFRPDQSLFEMAGCEFAGPQRAPVYNPETMETTVPGIYVSGTATAGEQSRHKVFIATCMPQALQILRHLRPDLAERSEGDLESWIGNKAGRHFPVTPDQLA